jgi:proline iminopeptidase
MEYALKYQQHLKGLIISNMMASAKAYDDYAHDVLMPQMDPKVLRQILDMEKQGKTDDPKYMGLLTTHYYAKHILRMPPDEWPDPVVRALNHMNNHLYKLMQGHERPSQRLGRQQQTTEEY